MLLKNLVDTEHSSATLTTSKKQRFQEVSLAVTSMLLVGDLM